MNAVVAEREVAYISSILTDILKMSFPLYRPRHTVAVAFNDGMDIKYRTDCPETGRDSTCFDISINSGVCELQWIEIERNQRHRGNGVRLYRAIEDFSRSSGCHRIVVPDAKGFDRFFSSAGLAKIEFGSNLYEKRM